jgi:hypothetical protein
MAVAHITRLPILCAYGMSGVGLLDRRRRWGGEKEGKVRHFGDKSLYFPAPVFPREYPFVTVVTLFHFHTLAFIKATFNLI